MSRTIRITSLLAAIAILCAAALVAANTDGAFDAGEIAEQRLDTRARVQSFQEAERQGLTAVTDKGPGPKVAAPGWGNEKVFSKYNDWEPNVAADPSSGYVYMLTTQYGGPRACNNCPQPIMMRISSDGGHTFGPQDFLCKCKGETWQADPIINTDANGNVYAAWLTSSPFGTVFSRSTDHGQTWTEPVEVMPATPENPWNDHPWMAVSDDGMDVYIGLNHKDNFQVSSHDAGVTWSEPIKTNPPGDYYFANGGEVMTNGDVVFVDSAFTCCGPTENLGPVDVVIIRSTDGGATWTEQTIATTPPMLTCPSPGCPGYQYGTEAAIARNGDGDLAVAYTAPRVARGAPRLYTVVSSDNGVTWSEPQLLSPAAYVISVFPAIAGGTDERFTVAWADNRNGGRRFNTFARDSFDSGVTWNEQVRISNLGHGAGYKHPAGYRFSYGDYFDIAINNAGEAFSAWGESFSYIGPGGTWYNVQEGEPVPDEE